MVTKISVIVPTYDREEHLKRLVTSFLNQTYRNTELLIGDDSNIPSAYLEEMSRLNENIHYFHYSSRVSVNSKKS